MSIGLKRGSVRLEPHDPAWDISARETIGALREILGADAADIQHVGSTAIQGIFAKPIVDIAVGMKNPQAIRAHDEVLAARGIRYRKEEFGDQLLYVMGTDAARTHFIHVVPWNGEAWHNYIAFRDYLNAHPEDARLYSGLKQSLAEVYPEDREAYLAGKSETIARILADARKWAGTNTDRQE